MGTRRLVGARRLASSLSWATIDQALSAASNFVITVAVARGLGVEGLGRFSLAFAAYITVLGFARSLVSEPLLADPRRDRDREVEGASTTLTLLYAVAAAIVVLVVAAVLGRPEFAVVACALPVVLLQDLLRYHAFRRKAPKVAAFVDGGWLVGSALAWPLITTGASVGFAAACWAAASALGIAAGWRALRPSVAGVRQSLLWWREHARKLAVALLADSVLVTIGTQTVVVVLAAMAGDAALGLLRAGQVYFGPLGIVFVAVGVLAVPHLSQRANPVGTGLAFRLSACIAGFAVLACVAVLVLEPVVGPVLLGRSVDVPGWLLLALALQTVVAAASGGLVIVSKARGRGGDIARSRLTSTIVGCAAVVGATATWGLPGAIWALVGQSALYTLDLAVRVARAPAIAVAPPTPQEPVDA